MSHKEIRMSSHFLSQDISLWIGSHVSCFAYVINHRQNRRPCHKRKENVGTHYTLHIKCPAVITTLCAKTTNVHLSTSRVGAVQKGWVCSLTSPFGRQFFARTLQVSRQLARKTTLRFPQWPNWPKTQVGGITIQGVSSARWPWLGSLWSWMFRYLLYSAWAVPAEQLGKMVEHPKFKSTKSKSGSW